MITYGGQLDGPTPAIVATARLPLAKSLCYSPAGNRPGQPWPKVGVLIVRLAEKGQ